MIKEHIHRVYLPMGDENGLIKGLEFECKKPHDYYSDVSEYIEWGQCVECGGFVW